MFVLNHLCDVMLLSSAFAEIPGNEISFTRATEEPFDSIL